MSREDFHVSPVFPVNRQEKPPGSPQTAWEEVAGYGQGPFAPFPLLSIGNWPKLGNWSGKCSPHFLICSSPVALGAAGLPWAPPSCCGWRTPAQSTLAHHSCCFIVGGQRKEAATPSTCSWKLSIPSITGGGGWGSALNYTWERQAWSFLSGVMITHAPHPHPPQTHRYFSL